MDKITFSASFGMKKSVVEISAINGSAGSYHLYVDRYYWGAFTKTDWGWAIHLPGNNALQIDDIQIIESLIEAEINGGPGRNRAPR